MPFLSPNASPLQLVKGTGWIKNPFKKQTNWLGFKVRSSALPWGWIFFFSPLPTPYFPKPTVGPLLWSLHCYEDKGCAVRSMGCVRECSAGLQMEWGEKCQPAWGAELSGAELPGHVCISCSCDQSGMTGVAVQGAVVAAAVQRNRCHGQCLSEKRAQLWNSTEYMCSGVMFHVEDIHWKAKNHSIDNYWKWKNLLGIHIFWHNYLLSMSVCLCAR